MGRNSIEAKFSNSAGFNDDDDDNDEDGRSVVKIYNNVDHTTKLCEVN